MFLTIKQFCKQHARYMLASFFIPLGIMAFIYLTIGIFPGSSRSILASDAFSQFSNFHASFRNALLGKQSFLYTWNASLGLNYLSLVSYYLGGLFTPLVLLFPNQLMPDALYFLTLLKIGSAGLAFWFYARQTFHIEKWQHVTLAVSYALMSFITAHSEIIMWLDAFVYLPLIIMGIDRLIQQHKPKLLFFSYLLLFLSSFYMGFMIAIFSALYFLVRLLDNWRQTKKVIVPYGLTALLSGGASMIIILPAILDLRANGEELSKITTLKTEATDFLDLVLKNLVGVYDTTKYGSIPFIYVGLLPLVLCLFYFVSKAPLKQKLLYAGFFALLTASFYLVPLNLFWHGMHAPNMFLFRYAYLFSFLVIMLAGYGWERVDQKSNGKLLGVILIQMALFCLAFGIRPAGSYEYIKFSSFAVSIFFLLLYLLAFGLYRLRSYPKHLFVVLILLVVSFEAIVNTNGMVRGILNDWNYASRSLYTEPYPAIDELVQKTKSADFSRVENLDPVSSNDSFNYGYSGVSMFSSIRNRHSSSYLDQLGFRSRGTNLNIRYPNNTLLMDSFLGIKYNLSKTPINKYGFTETARSKDYQLYENENALPLAFLANPDAAKVPQPSNDNLTSQTNLINGLADLQQTYFQFWPLTISETDNTTVTYDGMYTIFTEEKGNLAKEVTWKVAVPAHSQAYLSLYPQDFAQLESSTATITVNGEQRKSQINITGQYYDLGYYEQATEIEFTASFYGTQKVGFQNPQVVTLNTKAYQSAMDQIKEQGVNLNVGKRSAEGQVTTKEEQLLVTTIPYEKGWQATVDGKKVPVSAFQDAFVSLTLPKGKHTIRLSYLPQGFLPGVLLFFSCLLLFFLFDYFYRKQKR
ncbi:YfhO family protein [Enterococcus sp. JM9B]|uniref:YfhO family protein n=1 Tax=Enterococcus sp. JM9B TaxID=1857216 RepID=UPI00137534C6|nr:YfhO family protein [Enterococcus sp. JM9B]KAF1301700.1 copper ABC transporter permease [Enterococcus sp. JM9B]